MLYNATSLDKAELLYFPYFKNCLPEFRIYQNSHDTQIGVVANAGVLHILVHHKRLHTPVNLFVGNLAFADLLMAAVCPALFMAEDFYQEYVLGAAGCKLRGFVQSEAPSPKA